MNLLIAVSIITLILVFSLYFFINYQVITLLNRLETVMKLMENTIKQADATIQAHSKVTNMLNE